MKNRLILIGNCEAFSNAPLPKKQIVKSRYKGFRWVNYVDHAEDIVLIHNSYSQEHYRYREEVFGFFPKVWNPQQSTSPLNLAGAILEDRSLLAKLKHHVSENSQFHYSLLAVVNTGEVFRIAQALKIPVLGPTEKQQLSGALELFNSKIRFKEYFHSLGFETPGGEVSHGKEAILKAARQILKSHKGIMIRKSNKANCEGNLALENVDESSLPETIHALSTDWTNEPVLVEPFLDLQDSPCTLGYIHRDGSSEVYMTGIQVFAPGTYCWMAPPQYTRDQIKSLEARFLKYLEKIAAEGAVGWCDIDWGLVKGNGFVGIESNYRMTGWTPETRLIQRIFGKDRASYPVLFSCAYLPLKRDFSLAAIFQKLKGLKIDFDMNKKTGVIITSPPQHGYVGLLVLAETHRIVQNILNQLTWLSSTFQSFNPGR